MPFMWWWPLLQEPMWCVTWALGKVVESFSNLIFVVVVVVVAVSVSVVVVVVVGVVAVVLVVLDVFVVAVAVVAVVSFFLPFFWWVAVGRETPVYPVDSG